MKVIGIKHLTGTFNDRPYDNYNIYCINENDPNMLIGYSTQVIKVKSQLLNDQYPDPKQLINKEIDCFYDSYKNVVQINLKG